ncbi:hypothetical protein JAAARDRAFT_698577 [Jaapia argillacea MUCL 33604]|uniref:Uncharacterized protein n=1 Tax=Jaapia argillacea MUCL 33604 TaxID=933084 RepID=A0A067P2C1_9AGAM|nr:hypothetical protein JAAARDRAFT_698577 [Jaapia argillacea MUCL 33604]
MIPSCSPSGCVQLCLSAGSLLPCSRGSLLPSHRFLIDEMHTHDHTQCGQACFASNAMRYDDRIRMINTSAAECGNKGMKRIRKSVSFMMYGHAVQFTKVFLDVWNRNVINRMVKK